MIHALPGMGADHRGYPPPWTDVPDFVAHDWPPYRGARSITELARVVVETYGLKDGDSLVGASLGGMVACEIAKIRRLAALYLVASATHRNEISGMLAALHPLARIAPFDWVRFSASKLPSELAKMFSGSDSAFLRAMCAAVFQWEGLEGTKVRCFRIHGRHDLVIPRPPKVDLLLRGGHLISVTHAAECAAFVMANQESKRANSNPSSAPPGEA